MFNNKPLTIEVKGGASDERHLLTAVVGKTLREAGFSSVSIKNELGSEVPATLNRTSVYDLVRAISPTLFKADITVKAVGEVKSTEPDFEERAFRVARERAAVDMNIDTLRSFLLNTVRSEFQKQRDEIMAGRE